MKKYIFITIFLLMGAMSAGAQTHLREKVYITTDKSAYVAGDMMWISAFCIDMNTLKPSHFSNIAYVEIHSGDAMVQTGKVALSNGRGGGRIILSNTLPTGNYKILAYTAQSCNEQDFDYTSDSRTISIFNTFTSEREPDGVEIVDNVPQTLSAAHPGQVTISTGGTSGTSVPITFKNNGTEPVNISVSVYHDDGIQEPYNAGIASFVNNLRNAPAPGQFVSNRTPEYEGEIIRAKVTGAGAGMSAMEDICTFISAPGGDQNVYSSVIDKDGNTAFYTANIYGRQDVFLEIENPPAGTSPHLELISPFVDVKVSGVPKLQMSQDYAGALKERSLGMQVEKLFEADSLYDFLPISGHHLFTDGHIRYVLDDYTRFPSMEEVFIEFIAEARVRKIDGKREIQVRMEDLLNSVYFAQGASLLMVDGVPVLDQDRIFSYDPLLVQYIDIYPYTYFLGMRCFNGVVNLVTYKKNLPSFSMSDNVRIVDYQGPDFPMAYTCAGTGKDYPDYRQTLYWHPSISIEPGASYTIQCKTPAYRGRFNIAVEGLTGNCEPVSTSSSFDTR